MKCPKRLSDRTNSFLTLYQAVQAQLLTVKITQKSKADIHVKQQTTDHLVVNISYKKHDFLHCTCEMSITFATLDLSSYRKDCNLATM